MAGGSRLSLQRGFTLVEVLIASTILFAVLGVASMSYRAALRASETAERTVAMLTPIPLITAAIRSELRSRPVETSAGRGEMLGVGYEWEATTSRYGPPPRRFDPDQVGFVEYPPRFRLYDVRLTLSYGGGNREYLYEELAWELFIR
jgi:prepilin-type N-terminal cleavage/methylation domain-containing protein